MAGKGRSYGGCVYKRPGTEDTYELSLYLGSTVSVVDGKRKRKPIYYNETFHGTKKAADERMAQIVADKAAGKVVQPDKMTVTELMEYWFDIGCRQREWKENTRLANRNCIKHIRKHIGDIRLQKLTFLDIEYMCKCVGDEMQKAGYAGSNTVRAVFRALRDALTVATAKRLIPSNPADIAEHPKHQKRKRRAWTAEEQELVLAAGQHSRFYPMWVLMLDTGLRIGEACGLTWEDIDLDKRTVRVVRTRFRKGTQLIEGTPKSSTSVRTRPLTDDVVRALKTWKARQASERLRAGAAWENAANIVFTTSTGRPTAYCNVRRALMKVCEVAGVHYDGQHLFRHSFGTNMARSGVDPQLAANAMGHAGVAFYLDTYVSEPTTDEHRQAMEQVQTYRKQALRKSIGSVSETTV